MRKFTTALGIEGWRLNAPAMLIPANMPNKNRDSQVGNPVIPRRFFMGLFVALGIAANPALSVTSPFDLELLVKDGDPAAGTTGTLNLGSFTETSLATSCGSAYFYAESTELDEFSTRRLGIWQGTGATVRDIAINGQILPSFLPTEEECIGVGSTCGQIFRTSSIFYVSPVGHVLLRTSREDNQGPLAYLDGTANSNLSPVLTSNDTTFNNFPNQTFIALKTTPGDYLIDQYIGNMPFGEPAGGLSNFVTPLIGNPPPGIGDPVTVNAVFGNYFSQSGISFGFNQNADRLYGVEWDESEGVGQAIYFHGASDPNGSLLARTGEQAREISHGEYIGFTESITFGTIGTAQVNDSRTGFYIARWRDPSAPLDNLNLPRNAIVRFNVAEGGGLSQQLVVSEYGHPTTDIAFSTSEFANTAFDNIGLVQIAANGDIWFFAIGRRVGDGGFPDNSDERAGLWRKTADNDLELVWRYTTSNSPGSSLPDGPNVPGTPLPDGTFFVGTGSTGFGFDEHSHIVFAGPEGLYAEDSSGMRVVLAMDQQVEIAAGDTRTVAEIFFNREGHVSGAMQSYRDDQLVFMVGFTDGSDAIFAAKSDTPVDNNAEAADNNFIVNSTGDADDNNADDDSCNTGSMLGSKPECTLRAAIKQSNATPGKQLISFGIPGSQTRGGVFEIQISSNLPLITDPVTIDATTQCGYQPHAPIVELNAKPMGNAPSWGFQITAGNSTVKGFWINAVSNNAVLIETGGQNKIQANVIGTNIRGDINVGTGEDGIVIRDSSENTIGGTGEDDRNVVTNNGSDGVRTGGAGISIIGATATGNKIQGNYIGTDVTGENRLGNGNQNGISLVDAPENLIGGSTTNSGNVISGNLVSGILIERANSRGNRITGNIIGLSASAQRKVPNKLDGIHISTGVGLANSIGGFTDSSPGTGAGNIISGNDKNGIRIRSPGQIIIGNIVGTNLDSLGGLGNSTNGIHLESAANTVGTGASGSRNIVSGNAEAGILINTANTVNIDNNFIDANFIGTSVSGGAALPNSTGIVISNSAENKIGIKRSNLLSGNTTYGILLTGMRSSGNQLQNNQIGGAANGGPLGNTVDGVRIVNSSENRIGPGNKIQSSGQNGVTVIKQTLGDRNTISRNQIFNNTGLGIDLGNDGVTTNDSAVNLDGDAGANGLQNFPEITSVTGAPLNRVQGNIRSRANRAYTIEVFHNLGAHPSGYGEGEVFQSAVQVLTNNNGFSEFSAGILGGAPGDCISATATDILSGDSSEFSQCIPIPPPPPGGSNVDFGDAPERYPTLLIANGARHLLVGGLLLGTTVDAEPNGLASTDARGDNNNASNDEQGVNFPGSISGGTGQAQVEVTASGSGLLDAWIDFNNDGDWDDTSEQIFTSKPVSSGLNLLEFAAPSGAKAGTTFARFRLSASGKLTPAGPALNGEVEDYAVEIAASVPQPPTVTAIESGDGEILVSFSTTDNGGADITQFEATCGSESETGSGSPIIVANLTNGIEYSCTVTATNSVGTSAPSNTVSGTPESLPAGLSIILIKAAMDAE